MTDEELRQTDKENHLFVDILFGKSAFELVISEELQSGPQGRKSHVLLFQFYIFYCWMLLILMKANVWCRCSLFKYKCPNYEICLNASGNMRVSNDNLQHQRGRGHPAIKGNSLVIRPAVGRGWGCGGPASHVSHLIMSVTSGTRRTSSCSWSVLSQNKAGGTVFLLKVERELLEEQTLIWSKLSGGTRHMSHSNLSWHLQCMLVEKWPSDVCNMSPGMLRSS